MGSLSADKTDVGTMSVPYLRSELPAAGRYLAVAYGGDRPRAAHRADGVGRRPAPPARCASSDDDLADGRVERDRAWRGDERPWS